MERWITLDCYGTLIDWEAGIRDALAGLWPERDGAALLARFHELEPALQSGGERTYRQVLAAATGAVADAEGLEVPDGGSSALASSLPTWPPFPETAEAMRALRDRGWHLAILSNTDADLLDASLASIGVPVDLRVVASAIGSYKPAVGHWETFFRLTDADRTRHVHVAASRFHDVEPCAALGLSCVWVNRRGETSEVPRVAEVPDLTTVPDLVDGLVPA